MLKKKISPASGTIEPPPSLQGSLTMRLQINMGNAGADEGGL